MVWFYLFIILTKIGVSERVLCCGGADLVETRSGETIETGEEPNDIEEGQK